MSLVRTLKRFVGSWRRGSNTFPGRQSLPPVGGRRSRQPSGSRPRLEVLESRLLLAADFNGDGFADLAIAAPWEAIGSVWAAGAVHVLYGSASGLTLVGNQRWDEGMFSGAAAGDRFGDALAAGDFDGDGFDDLAIGIPYKDIGLIPDAGAVRVLYGSPAGLTAAGSQLWHQDHPGVLEVAEPYDRFGIALAAGDFNGDGKDDLAIGVPEENLGSLQDAGVVHVLYGTASGLSSAYDQLWHQDIPFVQDTAETEDNFGQALVAGDFNGDGKDDLAIGVPYEGVNGKEDAGAVNVLYGAAGGLGLFNNQLWHLAVLGISSLASANDHFGYSLAAGDFDGNGTDDLAIGVPNYNIPFPSHSASGAVLVLRGYASGLTGTYQLLTAYSIPFGYPQDYALFGHALTAGDFNGDSRDDLAIGAPYQDVGSAVNAGAVYVLYGSNLGLIGSGGQIWHQNVPGVAGTAEAGDQFGRSLAAGDFDGDGKCDLAIGVPGEDLGALADAGAVHVLYGSSSGLTTSGAQLWHQDSWQIVFGILYEMEGGAEPGDQFGGSLA